MLKSHLFIWICFGFVACWSQSKLTSYAKEITKTLCAPELHGRGYVNDGCNKAGEYILGEFERIGLQPFNGYAQQSFYLGVNTFPGNCKLKINGRKKKPGIDYLVHPSSASYHGKLSLVSLNAKEVLSYPFKSHAHGWGIAFIPPKSIAKDTLKMVRAKLEKLARVQMPVVEITRDKLTWSVSSDQFKFPYFDIDKQEEILKEYLRLTEKVAERMREKALAANTITIKVRFADFKTITRSKTLDLPTTGTQEIFEVVKALYLALNLDRALIRLVGVGLDSLVENEDLQQMVLGQRDSGWRQVDRAVDLVKEKFGRSSLRPARLVSEDDEDNSG